MDLGQVVMADDAVSGSPVGERGIRTMLLGQRTDALALVEREPDAGAVREGMGHQKSIFHRHHVRSLIQVKLAPETTYR
ncbi:hypothetical protein [Lysobacter soli]|uniref:hypothetical protein n=1 Tax=Lysobacter soli TaxID=453783 RepID=UPI00241099DD|nr:hypothetical protein [Lysobacter soli]MDG2518379.1 hypothetical protein [Lysobacter soli]